jgi:hypothetical protein
MRILVSTWALLLLSACGNEVAVVGRVENPTSMVIPADSPTLQPQWRDTMTITPATAKPGQEVALTFPARKNSVRGVAFSLADWTAEGWEVTYYLIADSGSGDGDWWRAGESEGRGWPDVGVIGTGPDHVTIPTAAAPGQYLLCTANAEKEACALLTVSA